MFKSMHFATKLLISLLFVSVSAVILISSVSYGIMQNLFVYSKDSSTRLGIYAANGAQKSLINHTYDYLLKLAVSQALKSNSVFAEVEDNIVLMASYMENIYASPEKFYPIHIPAPYETINGQASSKMTLAPEAVKSLQLEDEISLIGNCETVFSAIYHNSKGILDNTYLGTETGIFYRYSSSSAYTPQYDPRKRSWYTDAAAQGKAVWQSTYVDSYGEVCTTCSVPFQNAFGDIVGVAAGDILLESMIHDVLNVRIGETGYAFLLDNVGNLIAGPNDADIGKNLLQTTTGSYLELIQAMADGKTGIQNATIDGNEYIVAYSPLKTTGWSIGITVELAEIVAPAIALQNDIDAATQKLNHDISSSLTKTLYIYIILFSVIIIVVFGVSFLISGAITKPVLSLTKAVTEIGKGNLDIKIPIHAEDEIGALSLSFNGMTEDLKKYMAKLEHEVIERQSLIVELEASANIQKSMLPKVWPDFQNIKNLSLYAFYKSAKEVSGDFYDFYFLDGEKTLLCTTIADVSGKGMSAALFMTIAKALLKNHALRGLTPEEVFEKVNGILCQDNEMCMFVTTFMGILNLQTGAYVYISAGHNPPLISSDNSGFAYLTVKRSPPLGIKPNATYTSSKMYLNSDDTIILYTDGVTEAMNPKLELLGDALLKETVSKVSNEQPEQLVNTIFELIADFTAGHEQSDDITLLVTKYTPSQSQEEGNERGADS